MSRPAALAALAALALAACGKDQLAAARPHATLSPARLDFGRTPVLFPVRRAVSVGDGGGAPLHLLGATLRGAGAGAFAAPALPPEVLPGAVAELAVTFLPVAAGLYAAELAVATDDPEQPELVVALSGEATAPGSLSVQPAALDFGRVGEGQTATRELVLSSGGPADLYLGGLSFVPEGGPFALVGSAAPGSTLPAGRSAALAVRFSPRPETPGAAGTLVVDSSDPLHPRLSVPLAGSINRAPLPRARGHLSGDPPQETLLTTGVGATVLLDALASTDPDGDLPLAYAWTVAVRPEGSLAQVSPAGAAEPAILLDQPGAYSLQLAATDAQGLKSLAPARLDLRAVPPLQLVVELLWDAQRPDLDLHLLQEGAALGSAGDCGWTQPDPDWFPGGPDRNPHHLGDALVGYGPELVQWKEPAAGRYTLAVHLKSLHGATEGTTARVRVRAFGVLAAELSKKLSAAGEVWTAGTVDWPTGRVTLARAPGVQAWLREEAP